MAFNFLFGGAYSKPSKYKQARLHERATSVYVDFILGNARLPQRLELFAQELFAELRSREAAGAILEGGKACQQSISRVFATSGLRSEREHWQNICGWRINE